MSPDSESKLPMLITMGDPAGIGPEIIAKAFAQEPTLLSGCVVAGDVQTMSQAQQRWGGSGTAIKAITDGEIGNDTLSPVAQGVIRVVQACEAGFGITEGRVQAQAGRMAGDCVAWAAQAALRKEVSAVVTAPLHKGALHAAGERFAPFPGHTELLQSLAAQHLHMSPSQLPVRMMLANEVLRVVLVSIHMSLRDAIEAVTRDAVLQTLRIAHLALSSALGRAPRLAVAGLNPHAGEGGLFGHEEAEHIAPAVAAAVSEGIQASGPYPPDTVFMAARRRPTEAVGTFDAVIAMHHDQGLIPVKYLGVDEGVNVTLGLPFVRTSPDHGTAFDIAGQGIASPASLLAAIRMARQMGGR